MGARAGVAAMPEIAPATTRTHRSGRELDEELADARRETREPRVRGHAVGGTEPVLCPLDREHDRLARLRQEKPDDLHAAVEIPARLLAQATLRLAAAASGDTRAIRASCGSSASRRQRATSAPRTSSPSCMPASFEPTSNSGCRRAHPASTNDTSTTVTRWNLAHGGM